MASTPTQLPSLLVFGPQAGEPSSSEATALRKSLLASFRLKPLVEAVVALPEFWKRVAREEPTLGTLNASKHLDQLANWLIHDGPLPLNTETHPNVYALAMTLLRQVSEYSEFLDATPTSSHAAVLTSLKEAGAQGLCVGLLSALVVGLSRTENDIGSLAATALRLIVLIGAAVDHDNVLSGSRYRASAVRWHQGTREAVEDVVKGLPEAYISSINDDTSVTITHQVQDEEILRSTATSAGLRITPLRVAGRFHWKGSSHRIDHLEGLAMTLLGTTAFPDASELRIPVRNTLDGSLITSGSLTRLIIHCTLSWIAEWNETLKAATAAISNSSHPLIAVVGSTSCFPTSLAKSFPGRVLPLTSLSTTQRVAETPVAYDVNDSYPEDSIAIVGMAGRFPDADNVDELWDLLIQRTVTVTEAPVERLSLPTGGDYANTTWYGNFLRNPGAFDHKFFKKSSREAIAWDPQQRVLLEVIYEALESSGYFGAGRAKEPHNYGCYIGAVMNNYYDNLQCHPATAYATVGTSRCYLSGCMSHYFGWTGPSLTIDTACSSSLVAINAACRAIRSGECSRAVAGGTNVISSPFDYQNLGAAGFLSPSGQCKPFDADADGYCRGEAVAVVVLKPLREALAENDNILGVVVGSAANQNYNCGNITAPYSASQVELYNNVMNIGNVKPEEVSYVEAHGTGTGVGDPIEMRSIADAFCRSRQTPLPISSIKGNIGHTEATAGVAGLIKVLLMMRHHQIPPQASFKTLNPKLTAFDPQTMVIPTQSMSWGTTGPLVACVNSYGAAGSNSAVMLRETPIRGRKGDRVALSAYPVFVSAGSGNSLVSYCKALLSWLDKACNREKHDILASLAFHLADRANHALSHALSFTASSISELRLALSAAAERKDSKATPTCKPVVLVFGGQESSHIGLSRDVYQASTIFKKHLDSVNDMLVAKGLESFYPAIFEPKPMSDIVTLHAALFAVQYASARSWLDSGLNVEAVIGHSFGQLTALCVSGSLSLADGFRLVTSRASLMQNHWGEEAGSMLFVQASRDITSQIVREVEAKSPGHYAEMACYNGPESHVIVGSRASIAAIQEHVAQADAQQGRVRTKLLDVTNGFHSAYTEPVLPLLESVARELDWQEPMLHLEPTEEHESSMPLDYSVVARHTRQPVFFQHAVQRLVAKYSNCTWIEAGRGSSVLSLVKQSVSQSTGHTFHAPQLSSATSATTSLAQVTAALSEEGHAVQFWPFHRSQRLEYDYLSLPPIQFEKHHHFLSYQKPEHAPADPRVALEDDPGDAGLLQFAKYVDEAKTVASFRINPESERFQKMLSGHVMAGQTLAPASLYFEVVARAALHLADDRAAVTYVPTVKDLTMNSPIGHNKEKAIVLLLTKTGRPFSWSFSITTQDKTNTVAAPFEHSTGVVLLKSRDDRATLREFERFERLTGARRYDEVMNHPDAEKMQGRHVYRAFNTVVTYNGPFQGIKQVACVDMEAAGNVRITPPVEDSADQRLVDTPMTDSFMQFAGFLVNYFNNPSMDNVFVCAKIEHIELAGAFDPDAGEWLVYSTMSEGGETDASSDAYIFDAKTKRMVMAAFGFRFHKMSQNVLARMLKSVNKSAKTVEGSKEMATLAPARAAESVAVTNPAATVQPVETGKRKEVLAILSNITDVPVEDLKDSASLDDLGVDSLMATEVLNDIRGTLGLTIDLASFLFFPNVGAVVDHINEQLGLSSGSGYQDQQTQSSSEGEDDESGRDTPITPWEDVPTEPLGKRATGAPPSIHAAAKTFENVRCNYDQLAASLQTNGFLADAHPAQERLVLAYVVEAFRDLGCNLASLRTGQSLPVVKVLDRHSKLLAQLYRVLKDGKLITGHDMSSYVRSSTPCDHVSAESIYQEIIGVHPQHDTITDLVRAVGSELASCLRGDKDGLQIVFGDRATKKTLEDMYEFLPILRAPTLLLGDFLAKAMSHKESGTGKFRILEIGAGTGGTTKYLVNHLRNEGIDFEYVFTDLSASLVNAAAKKFKGTDELLFDVLDLEKPPKPEYQGAFHCVVATNCVHATRDLQVSLKHAKQMLRDDGALALIEITRNMYWLDVIVGLFEGWWLFEDGRQHALISERQWERRMKDAGFQAVSWSDGSLPEAELVRVITAFPTAAEPVHAIPPVKQAMETVVYKTVDGLDIQADIYFPAEAPHKHRDGHPVALMIHGGSHMIFSRKDIRPAQTRLLLNQGFVAVSLDYRLCPEVALEQGPMVDVCDALAWAQQTLPKLKLRRADLRINGSKTIVIGWSSGGQLAMSLAWTAPQRGLSPPLAILSLYAPTDYEDEWWQHPIDPNGAPYQGQVYDVLEGVQEAPIAHHSMIGAWEEPIADPRSVNDSRCRIIMHINWKAQTLPVILQGLPSKKMADPNVDWAALPQPSSAIIQSASPRAHVRDGSYRVPTFLIHGTADDLIPWQQSQSTYETLRDAGVETGLELVEGAPHICDSSNRPESAGWRAVLRGYAFVTSYVN